MTWRRLGTLLPLLIPAACGGDDDPDPSGSTDPSIVSFTAASPSVGEGEATDLSYAVSDATRVEIRSGDGSILLESTEATGTVSTGPLSATTEFTLRAEGEAGTPPAEQTLTVTVNAPATPIVDAFSAAPSQVNPGETVTLTWETSNADSVDIVDGSGGSVVSAGDPDGSIQVQPTETSTYELTATSASGDTAQASVTVTVDTAPRIVSFDADPNPIELGASTTLSWEAVNADSLEITAGGTTVGEPTELTGTLQVAPDVTTNYVLTARASGETDATRQVTVTVNAPGVPTIASFDADPDTVDLGDISTLSWEVSGADTIEIAIQGGDPIVTDAEPIGTVEVSPTSTTTYQLTATNAGGPNSASVTVTVNPSAPLIRSFDAGDAVVATGDDVVLTWETLGADAVSITQNGVEITTAGDGPGTFTATAEEGTNSFELIATNPTGENRNSAVVTGQSLPVIASFSARPTVILGSEPVEFSWSVRGTVELDLLVDGNPVPGFPALSGPSAAVQDSTGTFTATIAATASYVLRAATAAGPVEETVTVTRRPPFVASAGATQSYTNETLFPGGVGRFEITVSQPIYLEAATTTGPNGCTIDTILTLLDGTGSVLGSDDDDGVDLCSQITREDDFARLGAGSYELQVTERPGTSTVTYALTLDAIEADVCGNGVIDGTGEACDDGNTTSGDGCSDVCESELFDAQPGTSLTRTGLSVPAGGSSTTQVTVTSTIYLSAETFSDAATEACTNLDTTMTLFDDQGNEIGFDDDDGVSLCSQFAPSRDAFARLGPGDYDVVVEQFSGSAISSFDLVLSATEADVCANGFHEPDAGEQCDDGGSAPGDGCDALCQFEVAGTVSVPTTGPVTRAGSIANVGDFEAFEITATASAALTLETFAIAATSSCASIDTRISLVDVDGVELGTDFNDGVNSCSKIDAVTDGFASVGPGTFYAIVRENGDDATISGYDLTIDGASVGCGNGVVESPELCDDGNLVNGDDCTSSCEPERQFVATAATSTTFTGVSIAVGAEVPIGISVSSAVVVEMETFSDAVTGDCTSIDTVMSLRNASYTEIAFDDDGGSNRCSSLSRVLSPGDYVLEVYEFGQNSAITTDVVLSAAALKGSFTASPMSSTTFTSQSIAVGEVGYYEIDVPTGGSATVEIETFSDASTNTCSGIDTVITLFDDEGTELGFDDDGGQSTCSAITSADSFSTLQPGTYYLGVEEFGRNAAITYDVFFEVP